MTSDEELTAQGVKLAPDGQVYVCAACGKRSRSRYGFDASGARTALDYGWDESCMLHAVLCYERKPGEDWKAVES